jgi:peptide/nickel transport system permease protein
VPYEPGGLRNRRAPPHVKLAYARVQPGLLLAWAVMIVAALMAIAPQLFTAYSPLEGFPGAQRLARRPATGWEPTSWAAICGAASSSAPFIRFPPRWRRWRSACLSVPRWARWPARWRDAWSRQSCAWSTCCWRSSLLLSLTVIILLGFGTLNAAVAVGAAAVASFARLARAEVVRVRHSDFVEAAYGSGGTFFAVFWRHILPNSLTAVLAFATLQFGQAILALSTLSFLGYGTPPPVPEWGLLIAEGRNYLSTAWWLTTLPGIAVIAVVLAANRISRQFSGERR